MAVLLVPPYLQFFDADGNPLSGGKIYSYSAGTTTKKATYTDETATHQNTNPIILDDAGRAVVFIQGSYRFDTYDANDVLIRSVDNVTSFATLESSNNAYFESFSGTGSKTSFTTSETLGTESAAIQVYVSTPVQSYVDNGDFASDTIWTKGSGWSIGAGVATATGAISTAISQTSPKTVTSGRAYRVTYTITRSAGGLIPSIGGADGTERTASGTYTEIVIAGSTQTIAFTGNGFTGTLDTVTIENIDTTGFQIQDPSTYTINGTALEFAVAPPSGTNNIYVFAPTQLVGAAVAAADQAIAAQAAAEAAVITVQNQKIVWMGDWAAGTYNINEAVFYNGSSWIVTAATTIDTPSIASPDWDLLCEKGTDGTGGIPSPTASQVYSFLRASGTGTYTWFSGTTTVSAASTISLVGGNTTLVTIAGSGTINSFGTPVYSGDIRFVRFGTSTVTLTHSSSSGGIELPGAANISTTTGDYAIFVSSSTGTWRCWSYSKANGQPVSNVALSSLGSDVTKALNTVQDFRLTLSSGNPVADVSSSSVIYATPYTGNSIALYNGTQWNVRTSNEFSVGLAGLTANRPYDLFCYDNAGVPTLEFTSWTNDTTRTTNLTRQDGVLVKSGNATRRYIGTFYATSSTTTQDDLEKRFLWNYNNRVLRTLRKLEATASWTYTTNTFRQVNGSSANQIELVCGVAEDNINIEASATCSNSGGTGSIAYTGIGINSASTDSSIIQRPVRPYDTYAAWCPSSKIVSGLPSVGRTYYTWLEKVTATGTTTWYGNSQNGITGTWNT